MSTRLDLVDGWTGPVDFQLLADGVVVNLTGSTVALVLKDRDGNVIATAGNVTVPDAVNGKVEYTPIAGDIVVAKSPYSAHWKVTDGTGKIVFFPSGAPDVWVVAGQ